jgi:hypothetical protein
VIQHAGDFLGRQHCGQVGPSFGSRDLVVEPALFEDPAVEKLQGSPIDLNRAPGVVLLFQQVEQVTANVFRFQLFGRLPKMPREPLDCSQVSVTRAFGQVAQPQLFRHAFS